MSIHSGSKAEDETSLIESDLKSDDDESSRSNDENDDLSESNLDKNEKTTELVISQEIKEANEKNLDQLLNDINYGVILSYFDKFGKHLSKRVFIFTEFEANISNSAKTSKFSFKLTKIKNKFLNFLFLVNRKLSEFYLNLIKHLSFGKNAKLNKLEYYLLKVMFLSK